MVTKQGKWWAIEAPTLGIVTQGHTKKEAYAMVVEAIESLAYPVSLGVSVYPVKGEHFEIGSSNSAAFSAFFLRRHRQIHGLSLAEVSARLGLKSRNAYARYEQGKAVPTVEKLSRLLKAVTPDHEIVLSLSG